MARNNDDLLDDGAMAVTFAVFEHFLREADMRDLAELLSAQGIRVRPSTAGIRQWEENVIVGHALRPKYYLEIPEAQFSKARYILRERAEEVWAGAAVEEHPFAEYTNDELLGVLRREEVFGVETTVVARNLLLRRGVDLDLKPIRDQFRARDRDASASREVPFILLLFLAAGVILSGLLLEPITFTGLFGITYYYRRGTSRSLTGARHLRYGALTRVRSGWVLSAAGIAVTMGLVNAFYVEWITIEPIRAWWWWWR